MKSLHMSPGERLLGGEEWEDDVTPPSTALYVAAGMATVVVLMMACSFLVASGRERERNHQQLPKLWDRILKGHQFGFRATDIHGHFTTQFLCPLCAIPSLLVLAGIQFNFKMAITIVTCFPALLLAAAACLMYRKRTSIMKQYKENETLGQSNQILEMQLRTFQIQSIFADPDEPLSRIILIGLSQLMLLGFYVWGLWDAGRPTFDVRRDYGYYYAGIFLQLSYVIGKARSQQTERDKAHDSRRRDSIPIEDPVTYQSIFYHCSQFWAYYYGGVLLFQDDLVRSTKGNELDKPSCLIRYLLDLTVNTAGIFYIMVGLPIQVSHNVDPIDFVLNVVAAFYIVELDDLDASKVVKFPMSVAFESIKMEPGDVEQGKPVQAEQSQELEA